MASSVFNEVGSQLIARIFGGILWFAIAAVIVGALGFSMWYVLVYKRKFNIKIKIISDRAEEKNSILFDKAAILLDKKTNSKYFSLWSIKKNLPVPNFNVIQLTADGDYIELYRTGENAFYYLTPTKVWKKGIIKADGKVYPFASQSQRMIDSDMEYWSQKRKDMNKGMFDQEKMWMKLLPYFPQIIGGVMTVFILYILMSHLPGILAQLSDLSKLFVDSQRAAITVG